MDIKSSSPLDSHINCSLCHSNRVEFYHRDKKREYLHCQQCKLVFVPSRYHLSESLEKAEYDKHENQFDDAGYLRFLSRTFEPAVAWTKKKVSKISMSAESNNPVQIKGLDFGCGPAPVLANEVHNQMQEYLNELSKEQFTESKGRVSFEMQHYDPIFFPETELSTNAFHTITCTEVVEHLNAPQTSWRRLVSLMAKESCLFVMTKLVIDKERFAAWHYKNDPTHVAFYCPETFQFLAGEYDLEYRQLSSDVAVFIKS